MEKLLILSSFSPQEEEASSSFFKEIMIKLQTFISSDHLFFKNWFDNN